MLNTAVPYVRIYQSITDPRLVREGREEKLRNGTLDLRPLDGSMLWESVVWQRESNVCQCYKGFKDKAAWAKVHGNFIEHDGVRIYLDEPFEAVDE